MYKLHESYKLQTELTYFDDTSNTDNWQKEVYTLAARLANNLKYKVIWDFGTGSGFKLNKYFYSKDLSTIGVDLPPTVKFLKEKYPNKKWLKSDEFNFNELKSNSMFICSDVIEHMDSPELLLKDLASSDVGVVVFSTPARELLVELNQTNKYGPPINKSHLCEWTSLEFNEFISEYFNISEHFISHIKQATQVVIAYPKSYKKSEYVKVLL